MRLLTIYISLIWFLYFLAIPIAVCLLHSKNPHLFSGFERKALFALIYSLFSWVFILAAILVPDYLELHRARGAELCFALFFGWLYLWIASVPCFFVYGLLLLIHSLLGVQKKRGL